MSNQKDAISIVIGNFNAWSSNWCKYDISNNEGVQIDSLTSAHDLKQLICEPTQILSNSSSCFDLILTNRAKLVLYSGMQPSLNPICHHQIIHQRLIWKLNISSLYERHVWNYAKANEDAIWFGIAKGWLALFVC